MAARSAAGGAGGVLTKSDAEDVLIRATRPCSVAPRCRETGHVRRAPRSSSPRGQRCSVVQQDRAHVPPPLATNCPAGPADVHFKATSHDLCEPHEELICQAQNKKDVKALNYSCSLEGTRPKEHDIVISQYTTGGKEAIRAALKQRLQSAPSRQEVKVQLLPGKESPLPEAQPNALPPADRSEHGTANIAAVVSATLAATAPIFKAQSDVEARVSRLSESLRRLQEASCLQNQGSGCQATWSMKRVAQLEEQLCVLTQQKLHHLEKIQEQQLELQQHLIRSAVDVVTTSAPVGRGLLDAHTEAPLIMDACGHSGQKPGGTAPRAAAACVGHDSRQSPLETPAPRYCVPRPISQEGGWAHEGREPNSTELHREACLSSGNGRHLEEIPDDPTYPRGATQSTGGHRVAIATVACQPEISRTRPQQHTVLLPMSPSTADLDQPGFASRRLATSALGSTSQGASDAQAHFNWMKADLQVQPGDAFALEARKPTQASGSMRPTVSTPLPYPHVATPEECPSCQPVEIQKSLPPPSVLENARKNFQGVCHRRKILDENLEAMCRARDREAFYALLDSISCTGDITEKMRIKKTVDAWMWFSRKGMQNTPSETKSVQEAEEYLKNIYGKDLFKSNHRTQKTSPYLRCTSPSKKSKGQRSSTVDRVKGVKVKSAKTQTSPFRGQALSPVRYTKQQNIFRPTPGGYRNPHEVPPNLLEDFLLPMAIPLGKPRVYDMGRQSSCVVAEDQPITTTSSIAQSSPRTAASKARRPNATVLEVRSAKKGLPQLQVQVLPSVNIDSVSSESLEDSPSPPPPSPSIQTVRQTVVELEPEEEEREVDNVFPGTEFLAVADITQEPQAAEQLEDIVIQLNGIGEPPAPLYHGPVPHPQAPDPPAAVDTSLSAILEREGLESRLVEWVEQQVMARTVTELSLQPDKFESASFSEEQDSSASTSNIAEAASRASPLFVLTGIPVDSELVRQYVDEALAETVALFLGQREGQSPVPPATVRDDAPAKQEPVVCTPVPTPSPRESPSHGAVPLPLATPEASEQECVSSKEAQYTLPEAEHSLMNTPHTTPAASPPRPSTPSPPPTLWSPEPVNLQSEPWGGRERPLEEETEPCGNEELQQQLVMSVAREEESVSLISPTPSILPEPLPPPPHSPRQETPPPRPTPSTEDSSSVLSITETDMLGRHISEGELVMSCGQMTAVRGLLEEGLVFPNLNGSLSSSLHGLQDMEYDPPSEGQLPRRRDPVLSLLGKMNQGLISHQEEACTNEALWEIDSSSLELSDEQRSRLSRQHVEDLRISSPGQVSLPPGVTGGHLPGRHHPVSMEHLEEGVAAHVEPQIPNDPSHCKDAKSMASEMMVHSVAKPAPILVRQYQEKPTHAEEGDASPSTAITALHENVAVHLSSASQNGGSVSISTVEGDTDTSGSNVF